LTTRPGAQAPGWTSRGSFRRIRFARRESVARGRSRRLTAYLFALAVALIVIAIIVGGPIHRRRRQRRLRAQPLPAEWLPILDHYVPGARYMPEPLRQRWHDAIKVFLAEKRFVGCDGLGVTDEMRVAIAGQACLMILNRPQGGYEDVEWILIYPSAFHVPRHDVDEAGVETIGRDLIIGESWDGSRVIISWDDVRRAAREGWEGENVVLHEFAHQLDAESGGVDGAPALAGHGSYDAWAEVLGGEYRVLQEKAARGDPSVLDHYGASDPGEFFAVATEAFFQSPDAVRAEHPQLYAQLRAYYQLDPAAWRQ
jgi:Mlc titration factor MtfA (ptsG expression regulator)